MATNYYHQDINNIHFGSVWFTCTTGKTIYGGIKTADNKLDQSYGWNEVVSAVSYSQKCQSSLFSGYVDPDPTQTKYCFCGESAFKVYLSPSSQTGPTISLKIDLTTTEAFSKSVRFKCTQGTTSVYTNTFSVNVQCGNYNNVLNTLSGSTWLAAQTKKAGNPSYLDIPIAKLDTRTSLCPITMQAFVSQSDTVTQVSTFVATSGFTASDVFKYDPAQQIWFFDGISDYGEYWNQRDEEDYTFYIRITQQGGYTEWISSQASLYCDPCIDQAITVSSSEQTTGSTYVYDLNDGSSNVKTENAFSFFDLKFTKTSLATSTNGCDAIYFYLFADSALSTPWSDSDITLTAADTIKPETKAGTLTTQSINLQTSSGFSKTVYVQGKNTGKLSNWIKSKFVVCGQETVTCNQATDYVNINLQKYYVGGSVVDPTLTITKSVYSTWFTETEGLSSDSDCFNTSSYNLCKDSACSSYYSETSIIKIESDNIVITLNPFNQVDLYLQKYYPKGKKSAARKMSIATCGLETVSMTDKNLEITYEYEIGTSVEGTNKTWIIYSSEFETNFVSSNAVNCPLYLIDIVEAITYDSSNLVNSTTANTNSQLSVVSWGTNQNFNIYLETTGSFAQKTYYLRASTQSTFNTVANCAYMKLNLQVVNCTEQSILMSTSSLALELTQYQSKSSISVVDLFESTHPTFCPITSYSIYKVKDASTKKDLTSETSSWIYFGDSTKEKDFDYLGNLIVSNTKNLVNYNIYIQASTGNATSSVEDPVVSLSIVEQLNIAPYFMSDLEKTIEIDLSLANSFTYTLPEVVDLNPGQEVTVTVESDAEFIQYDQEQKAIVFSGITQQDIGKYEIQVVLQDSKLAVVEFIIDVEIVKTEQFQGVKFEVKPEKKEEKKIEKKEPPKVDTQYPKVKAKVASISAFGDVLIQFSEEMLPFDYEKIDEKVIQVEIIPFDIPEGFDESKLAFTWKVISYEEKDLTLKLKFENPVFISLSLVQDIMVVRFLEPEVFISKNTLQVLDVDYHRISESVKKQMPDTDATKNFESASEMTDVVLKWSFWATLAMNVVMSGSESMDYFLAMLNSLQLIIHLPMLWVIMPGNVTMFFKLILPIVMFDVLNGLDDTPYDPNNFIEYDEEENQLDKNKFISQMKDLGYNTHNAILNLGSLFILLIIYFIRMILLGFLFLIKGLTGKCKETYQNQKRKVFFNELLLILVEGYMEFFISGYLNFQKPLYESIYLGEKISIVTSWFSMFGALFIAPVALCFMIDQDQETLETQEFEESFGSSYEGIKTETRATRSYFFFFILRRLIFCCASFFLNWSSAIQLQCVLLLNIFMSIYICYFRAKKLRIFNRFDIAAEFFTQLTTVHLMIFTDYVPDPDIQYLAGYTMIGAIAILMMGHMAFVIYYGTKTIMLVFVKYYRRAKFKIFGIQKIEEVQAEEPIVIQPNNKIKKGSILDKYIKIQSQQKLSKISEELDSRPETPQETPREVSQVQNTPIEAPQIEKIPIEPPQIEKTPRQISKTETPQIQPVTHRLKKDYIDIKLGQVPNIQDPRLINVKPKKVASFNLPKIRSIDTISKPQLQEKKKSLPKKPEINKQIDSSSKKMTQIQTKKTMKK